MNTTSQTTIETLVGFIQKTFQAQNKQKAIIAVSGGIDSAVSLALTVKALGPRNVYPLLLPYGKLSALATADAQLVCQTVAIPDNHIEMVDIQPIVDQLRATDPSMDNLRQGNCMARVRMIIVFDRAKKLEGLVVGTENKTEHYLGYYTRFGDEASDLEPLRGIYKTEVWEFGRALGIPEKIITKSPSANLWEGQTDEAEFGFSYQEADQVIREYLHEQFSQLDINKLNPEIKQKIIQRIAMSEYKHKVPFVLGS
jgi:NAD+ synthase